MATLRLELRGAPKTISLASLAAAIDNWRVVLLDLDAAISRVSKGSVEWVISDLSVGSACIEIEGTSKIEHRNYAPDLAAISVAGFRQLEEEGTTPPYLSDRGIKRAGRLLKIIGHNGVSGIIMRAPSDEATLTAKAAVNVEQLLPTRYVSLGSVEGALETISIHGGPKFVIYHDRTKKAVNCSFPQDWLERVKEALGRRVNASGTIHWNARGEQVRVDVEDMQFLRRNEELPSIREMTGGFPDLTGGQSTEEFLRRVRCG